MHRRQVPKMARLIVASCYRLLSTLALHRHASLLGEMLRPLGSRCAPLFERLHSFSLKPHNVRCVSATKVQPPWVVMMINESRTRWGHLGGAYRCPRRRNEGPLGGLRGGPHAEGSGGQRASRRPMYLSSAGVPPLIREDIGRGHKA